MIGGKLTVTTVQPATSSASSGADTRLNKSLPLSMDVRVRCYSIGRLRAATLRVHRVPGSVESARLPVLLEHFAAFVVDDQQQLRRRLGIAHRAMMIFQRDIVGLCECREAV